MKTYTITVNGNVYEVTVEEGIQTSHVTQEPKARPVATSVAPPTPPVKKVTETRSGQGSVKINSPMPGKILGIKVKIGDSVKRGDVILLLEAMKMENEIVATHDGVVVSIDVNSGDTVDPGAVLMTLN